MKLFKVYTQTVSYVVAGSRREARRIIEEKADDTIGLWEVDAEEVTPEDNINELEGGWDKNDYPWEDGTDAVDEHSMPITGWWPQEE